MNKISKKIVALATMAAFVLTLVPAAAFADTRSSVSVVKDDANVTITSDGYATADVTLDIAGIDAGDYNYVVWLEDANNDVYYYAEPVANDVVTTNVTSWPGAALIVNKNPSDGTSYDVQFKISEAGTYTVHAAVDTTKTAGNYDQLTRNILATSGQNTITVEKAETVVKTVSVAPEEVAFNSTNVPNGINSEDVTVTVASTYADGTGNPSSKGTVVTVSNPYNNIHVQQDGKDVDEITIESGNTADVKIVPDSDIRDGVYTIKFSAGNKSAQLKVKIQTDAATPKTINVDKTDSDIIGVDTTGSLAKVAQFTVKDTDGNVMTPEQLNDATPAEKALTGGSEANNVRVMVSPTNSTATFKLLADEENDVIALALAGGQLKVGKYTVRVALNSGNSADVSFNVEKFSEPSELKIEVTNNNDAEETSQLPMNTAANQTYSIKAVWVDKNGVEDDAENVGVGIQAADSSITFDGATLTIPQLIETGDKANTSLIGSTVTVYATDATNGFNVSREFTITDPANTDGIALNFDSEAGKVEQNNTVKVTVVNKDGEKVDNIEAPATSVYAYVADQSNEDAYVDVQMNSAGIKNGEGTLTVYADQETTAEIVIGIVDDVNGTKKYYGGTLNYTFGEADVNADKVVAMTIGSTDMIVDNEIVAGDAAPYVADSRTMVPIRALTEAFGAEVEFDNDSRTVTIVDGNTTVVMTIDETTYTVNGDEQTMDVAPVIGSGDRTYVPIRFVAEALGYKVTPLYAADGTTASVVFQK